LETYGLDGFLWLLWAFLERKRFDSHYGALGSTSRGVTLHADRKASRTPVIASHSNCSNTVKCINNPVTVRNNKTQTLTIQMQTKEQDPLQCIEALRARRSALLKEIEAIDEQLRKAQQSIQSILGTNGQRPSSHSKPVGSKVAKGKPAMTVDAAILMALKDKSGLRVADLMPKVTQLRKQESKRGTIQVQVQKLKEKGKLSSNKGAWSLT
jgi:hypothetical protein